MKKRLAFLMALCLLAGTLGLSGCTGGNSAGTSTPPPSDSQETPDANASSGPTPTPGGEIFHLVATAHSPASSTMTLVFQNFLDEIERRSDGRIQFDVYTDASLAESSGVIDALDSGIADVGMVNYSHQNGRLDLVGVCSLPGMFSNAWEANHALLDLYEQVPEMNAQMEAANLHLIGTHIGTPFVIISKTPVSDMSDLAGKRMVSTMSAVTSILEKAGATPLSFTNAEAYEALSKNSADGMASNTINGAAPYGIQEVAKYVYNINLGSGQMIYCMSKTAWDKLPSDLQQIVEDVKRDYQPDNSYQYYVLEKTAQITSLQQFLDAGVTIVEPTAEQFTAFQAEYAEASWQDWVSGIDSSGYDGQKVLDTYLELVQAQEGKCPDFG